MIERVGPSGKTTYNPSSAITTALQRRSVPNATLECKDAIFAGGIRRRHSVNV